MNTDLEKLGRNIRCLRVAYGQTQEEFFREHIEEILPVTYSEKAPKNKHFRNAHAIYRSIFEQLKKEYLDAYECGNRDMDSLQTMKT